MANIPFPCHLFRGQGTEFPWDAPGTKIPTSAVQLFYSRYWLVAGLGMINDLNNMGNVSGQTLRYLTLRLGQYLGYLMLPNCIKIYWHNMEIELSIFHFNSGSWLINSCLLQVDCTSSVSTSITGAFRHHGLCTLPTEPWNRSALLLLELNNEFSRLENRPLIIPTAPWMYCHQRVAGHALQKNNELKRALE